LKINYASLDRQFQEEKKELRAVFEEIHSSGSFILGSHVEELENKIADYCQRRYCISVNSGTDALILGMRALDIGPGDEVITPPNSFVASTSTIVHVGATPVFVDVKEDQNMDTDLIESAITQNTRAIMPVHLTGRIAEMNKIVEIAEKHNLLIIEDAAQSFGSRYFDKPSGSFGDIAFFSAHPLKLFNSVGDAGFILTDSETVNKKLRRMRNHGFVDRNTVKEWGVVSRLDAFKASVLNMRLTKIDSYIERRRKNVQLFRDILNKDFIYIPDCRDYEYNSFQTFVIQVPNRDSLQRYLEEKGVQTSIHYPVPIHLQPAAQSLAYKEGDFPKAEEQAHRILSIPVSQFLTEKEIHYIGNQINGFFSTKN
jgi:dTDP-4-amino-4,6-dideoxygalactose transaminase